MDTIPRTSGIYQITCTPTGKIYIGSAANIGRRWRMHQNHLRRNIHANPYLQRAWNKYKADSFVFSVLEATPIETLLEREQFYITFTRCTERRIGFNLRPVARAKPTKKKRMKQARLFHHSVGTKGHQTPAQTARLVAYWTGRKHRPESIQKMRDAKIGKPEPPNAAKAKVEATSKEYIVTDPQGNDYHIKNLSAFCREHGLTGTTLIAMARGRNGITQHKGGWKCRYP